MNKDVKEIIEVAEELTHIGKKAKKVGIIGVSPAEFQIYETDTFKKIVEESNKSPYLKDLGEWVDYRYRYRIKIDGIVFLYISDEPLYFKNSDMEIVEEIKL